MGQQSAPQAGREPLLIGVMLCIAALVVGGLLLAMPAVEGWQARTTQKESLTAELTQLTTQQQWIDQDIDKLSHAKGLPKDVVIRSSQPEQIKKNIKAMLDGVVMMATRTGNQLVSLAPEDPANRPAPAPVVKPTPVAASPALPLAAATTAAANAVATAGTTTQTTPAAGVASSATATTPPTGADATTLANTAGSAPVIPPQPAVTLSEHPYELVFRGNFDQVLSFLANLDHHKELVELTQVDLKNEGGAQRQEYSSSAPFNRAKPIALKLNLKLILQPDTMLKAPIQPVVKAN
jgi:hypothetical protein